MQEDLFNAEMAKDAKPQSPSPIHVKRIRYLETIFSTKGHPAVPKHMDGAPTDVDWPGVLCENLCLLCFEKTQSPPSPHRTVRRRRLDPHASWKAITLVRRSECGPYQTSLDAGGSFQRRDGQGRNAAEPIINPVQTASSARTHLSLTRVRPADCEHAPDRRTTSTGLASFAKISVSSALKKPKRPHHHAEWPADAAPTRTPGGAVRVGQSARHASVNHPYAHVAPNAPINARYNVRRVGLATTGSTAANPIPTSAPTVWATASTPGMTQPSR
jgi:hypothetical protein